MTRNILEELDTLYFEIERTYRTLQKGVEDNH